MFIPSLILLVCLLSVVFADDFGIPFNPTNFSRHNITSWDGTVLQALVFDSSNKFAKKKNPLLIFISSWGLNDIEYLYPAKQYCDDGYTVVSYTSRGFWGSSLNRGHPGDYINMAGSKDVKDVSAVIDWALKQTSGDATRIGLQGISYGAGISLMASGNDNRVKSVVAMSGWVDIVESLLGNGNTIKTEAVEMLQGLAEHTGSMDEELTNIFDDYFNNRNLAAIKTRFANNGAKAYLSNINQNQPALFMANGFGDSLFTPNQFTSFFNALTTPKHLEFAPGDHAGPEIWGLFPEQYLTNYTAYMGQPGLVWMRSKQWNDYYLKNASTGVMPSMPAVTLSAMNDGINNLNGIDNYKSWSEVSNKQFTFDLIGAEKLNKKWLNTNPNINNNNNIDNKNIVNGTGVVDSEVVSFLASGKPLSIKGGVPFLTATVHARVDPRRYSLKDVDRSSGAVFEASRSDFDYVKQYYRGSATLSLRLQSSHPQGILIAYLLDMEEAGDKGKLITFSPMSFSGVKPGKTFTLDFEFTLASWDFAAARYVSLVIGTHDNLYLDTNTLGQEYKIMDRSQLIIPLNNK